MKYYVFTYYDGKGRGGRSYHLAASKDEALKRLKRRLHQRYPFCKFRIDLENVMPAN